MRMSPIDWLMLITLSFIWGGSFFFNAVILREIPTLTLVAARVSLAALALWVFVIITGRYRSLGWRVWGALAILGAINNALPFSLIVHAQTTISSGLASILNATTPLFTILVAGVFLSDERLTLPRIFGVVLGLVGVVFMIGTDALSGLHENIWGLLSSLGAALAYGFGSTYGRRFRRLGVDPILVAMGQVTTSSLFLWPLAFWVDAPLSLPMPSAATLWSLFSLAIFCTSIAYIFYFKILESAGATNISMVTFLVPVSAIVLGILFLGETLHTSHILGMALIGLGLIVIDGRIFSRRPD
ncbi:DMT family transporter [Rhodobacteraceae bacterium]|nr:DMT family transporter [Paracoccaceae bacterium]